MHPERRPLLPPCVARRGTDALLEQGVVPPAGISAPPANWSEVVSDAKKLTNKKKTVVGMCMRGSETEAINYPFFLMFPYFAPYAANYKAEFLNQNWKPVFDTPQALTWATDYAALMQDYDPPGVSAYGYTDCEHAFQTGQTAMWWDNYGLETIWPTRTSLRKRRSPDMTSSPARRSTRPACCLPHGGCT